MNRAGVVVIAAMMAACGPKHANAPATPRVSNLEKLDALYNDAIRRSAVSTPGDALPLAPLAPDRAGAVTVSTWADCKGVGAANQCGGYIPGTTTLREDVWVAIPDELKRQCRTFKHDVVLKLDQLIGLPPHRTPAAPNTFEWQFVTFTHVPDARVFRPCTDTRTDTHRCSATTLPDALPANAPPDYYRWFTKQAMSAWQVTANGEPPKGYPWTRLGYTYNWAPDATSRYGVSEYVISGGASPVDVAVDSIETASRYCK